MCGFTGFLNLSVNKNYSPNIISKMLWQIKERGPDSQGVWSNEDIIMGHRRLSIVDLSPSGNQPMISRCGQYVIVYNGEVFNTNDLIRFLPKDVVLNGTSDTEIILELAASKGINFALRNMEGMFSFALYDRVKKELFLARDRLGIKPLYYGQQNGTLFFGSQLKSFFPHPDFSGEICPRAQELYFKYNYIPSPISIYKNFYKVKPAHYVKITSEKVIQDQIYWSLDEATLKGKKNPFKNIDDAKEEIRSVLKHSVKAWMKADVEVGAFLSGGIDSSLLVSLMKEDLDSNFKTFTIGFHENTHNEAIFAKEVSNHFGTHHIEEYLSIDKAYNIIPEIPHFCDEPFADASQIPTLLVSKLAKKHVNVVLSGDGGDELFGGYSRYFHLLKLRNILQYMPNSTQNFVKGLFQRLPVSFGKAIGPDLFFKMEMAFRTFGKKSIIEAYDGIFDFWPELHGTNLDAVIPKTINRNLTDLSLLQYHDINRYLPDCILTKTDRCSMHVGLEVRPPFLNHKLVELIWRLPDKMKYDGVRSKYILHKILYDHIPEKIVNRPKKGFGVPISKWIRGPLKEWSMDMLNDLKKDNIVDSSFIEKSMIEHLKGYKNYEYKLWGVLMWQHWKNNERSYNKPSAKSDF